MNSNALEVARQTFALLVPEVIILASATIMMTAGAFVRLPRRTWSASAAAALVAALVALVTSDVEPNPYAAVAVGDALAYYGRLGFLSAGLIVLAMAHDQVDDDRAAEFFGALLMVHAGAMLVATANELVFLFVGLELVSVPTYLLLYLPRRTTTTQEAATKYFYLSIFSSALLLFGLAYLYGLTGVSNLKALGHLVHFNPDGPARAVGGLPYLPEPRLGLIAVVFIVAGLGFRVAAVPFHFYAPDVYQGSPTVLTAMLAWVPKGIGFVAMLRCLTSVLGGENDVAGKAVLVAWVVAVATMTLGNTVALAQNNLKRLFAYSSIAHAGYLMIGVTAAFRNAPGAATDYLGAQGVIFYLATYALMTLGVFAVVLALHTPERPVETVDDLTGLWWSHPKTSLAMALCLFSLAGVPPLAGFWGKFHVFASALSVAREDEAAMFQMLAVIGAINAAIGAYYYLRIVVKMVLWPAHDEPIAPRAGWPTWLAVGACAGLSLAFGLYPAPIASASRRAAIAAIAYPEPITASALTAAGRAAPTR